MVTAGMDGAVYEWSMKEFKREREHVLKGCAYNCLVTTVDGKATYAVGSDKKLKEFEDQQGAVAISKEFATAVPLTQVCLTLSLTLALTLVCLTLTQVCLTLTQVCLTLTLTPNLTLTQVCLTLSLALTLTLTQVCLTLNLTLTQVCLTLSLALTLTLILTLTLTQVCLPSSGRMLLAASEAGTVRAYKFPLTGEFQEYQSNAGSITKMRVSNDDSLMFCVGDDGALFVYDIKDKEASKAKGGSGGGGAKGEPTPFAEEVLVTKVDLQEKQTRMAELETQVSSVRRLTWTSVVEGPLHAGL